MDLLIVLIDLAIMILAVVPAISFQRKYNLVPLTEFLLFSIIFYSVVFSVGGELGAILWDRTIFYQIQFLSLITIYYTIYGYASRIQFRKSPFILKFFMRVFYVVLCGLILFWRKMDQPDHEKLLFWDVDATNTAYYPKGAGLKYDGYIVLSTSYYLLVIIFILICLIWYLVAVSSVKLIIKNNNVEKARRMWVLIGAVNVCWAILVLPWTPNYDSANVLIVVQLFLILYIVTRIPEGMIISNSQFFRSYDLLVAIIDQEEETHISEKIGSSSFFEYLETVVNTIDDARTTKTIEPKA